jgi:uncharacterized protein (DUF983 family)
MPAPLPNSNDIFDGCPMCGHLFMTPDGLCEACGENLRAVGAAGARRVSLLNWRVIVGLIVFAIFATLSVMRWLNLKNVRFSDRIFHQLIIISLCCGALCGFVMFVKGVLRARRG